MPERRFIKFQQARLSVEHCLDQKIIEQLKLNTDPARTIFAKPRSVPIFAARACVAFRVEDRVVSFEHSLDLPAPG